jgi:hypothetical protein
MDGIPSREPTSLIVPVVLPRPAHVGFVLRVLGMPSAWLVRLQLLVSLLARAFIIL